MTKLDTLMYTLLIKSIKLKFYCKNIHKSGTLMQWVPSLWAALVFYEEKLNTKLMGNWEKSIMIYMRLGDLW